MLPPVGLQFLIIAHSVLLLTEDYREKRYLIVDAVAHEFLLLNDGMAKITAVAVWARLTSKHHYTNFCFVASIAYDWAKFLNSMS
uniref:Uncharacterized protein n=1 Tax=Tanacetum cinerariifolium TaxID=118510 RepID=A0A6L2KJR1_TANCI|nr:hypothetical protein [Tanacetum cinerariifolium]